MTRQPNSRNSVLPADILLWIGITVYIAIIYSTLSVVPFARKSLVERFGYDIFDWIFVPFIGIGIGLIMYGIRTFRGFALTRYFVLTTAAAAVFTWYLLRLPYAIERIHLFEYGLLGLLFCIAFRRHVHGAVAYGMAITATFLAGLGDEAIQGMLQNRVGEIRDALTNAVSGFFGIFLFAASLGRNRPGPAFRPGHLQILIVMAGIAAVASGLFLAGIQGFGNFIENGDLRIYSSLSGTRLHDMAAGATSSDREQVIFENEAKRHLFQRDFYFTNDFLAEDGSFYRDFWRAQSENRVLKTWYGPFLKKNGERLSCTFSGVIDKKVGAALGPTTVAWPDSLEAWVATRAGNPGSIFTSRVKSTMITGFTLRQLVFAEALALVLLLVGWIAVERRKKLRA
jgi:hypothetical protein